MLCRVRLALEAAPSRVAPSLTLPRIAGEGTEEKVCGPRSAVRGQSGNVVRLRGRTTSASGGAKSRQGRAIA